MDVIIKLFVISLDFLNLWKGFFFYEIDVIVCCFRFNRVFLFVNVLKRLFLFFGIVVGFGIGLLIVKKIVFGENFFWYGFLFGLSFGNDFRFFLINESFNVVDEVILV